MAKISDKSALVKYYTWVNYYNKINKIILLSDDITHSVVIVELNNLIMRPKACNVWNCFEMLFSVVPSLHPPLYWNILLQQRYPTDSHNYASVESPKQSLAFLRLVPMHFTSLLPSSPIHQRYHREYIYCLHKWKGK